MIDYLIKLNWVKKKDNLPISLSLLPFKYGSSGVRSKIKQEDEKKRQKQNCH
jgi:hypothetical protein